MTNDPMAPDTCLPRRRQRGFSYVEALIAVVILAVCLAPALDALRDGVRAAGTQLDYTKNQQRLKTRFEDVLANSFATLDDAAVGPCSTVAAYSDAAGTADRLLVTLYHYNGSAPTDCVPIGSTGLLWIKVAIEGSNLSLDTLKSRW